MYLRAAAGRGQPRTQSSRERLPAALRASGLRARRVVAIRQRTGGGSKPSAKITSLPVPRVMRRLSMRASKIVKP